MAYTPSTLTIASWTVPISIVGTDTLASLDNTVNAIIDTDASSAKAYLNTELAKIPTYLSGEMTSIYNDLAGQVNVIAGLTSSAAELNILDGATLSTAELNLLDGVTATTAELNIVDGLTATTAELNTLDGITATVSELNTLDGITATVTELNYVDGVTSSIQTQINTKAPTASPSLTGTATLDGKNILADTAKSFATNGYQKLSNGLILQWGTVAASWSTATTFNFNITFPNACFGCYPVVDTTANQGLTGIKSITTSTFKLDSISVSATDNPIKWFAIGY